MHPPAPHPSARFGAAFGEVGPRRGECVSGFLFAGTLREPPEALGER